ncbi:Hypothetical protein ETEE_2688 [Edwardsiella anguillarum ET080813]|uniref:Uncharacterized protein n=1 Tax=Edwardsiella anguillarum ET080813 TaxID=667120 RepID=A0A076LMN2_9GAMM|nr:Hypothetical protein ETEE_2688 [Edwardsiella anguillarum ET080813]
MDKRLVESKASDRDCKSVIQKYLDIIESGIFSEYDALRLSHYLLVSLMTRKIIKINYTLLYTNTISQ